MKKRYKKNDFFLIFVTYCYIVNWFYYENFLLFYLSKKMKKNFYGVYFFDNVIFLDINQKS